MYERRDRCQERGVYRGSEEKSRRNPKRVYSGDVVSEGVGELPFNVEEGEAVERSETKKYRE